MRQFLPYNRALWVQTVGMRRPTLSLYDLRRSFQKLRSFTVKDEPINLPERLYTLSPVMLPFGNRIIRSFNRCSLVQMVRRRAEELGFKDPILLTTLPNASDFLGEFNEMLIVYYCVDDFLRWPGVNKTLVAEMEERLLSRADLLVCSSGELANLKRRNGLNIKILPHGVDFDHFSKAVCRQPETVPLLEGLSGPRIGYFGLLGEWVDIQLLELMARKNPGWSFVFMGTVIIDTARLKSLPNVLFSGPVPYERLPEYVSYLDVLILPYRTSGRGHSITPLKLREYLATGKPVVATAIPECKLYEKVMFIAKSHEEFLAGVEQSIAEGTSRSQERRTTVSNETWLDRAEVMSSYISDSLAMKYEGSILRTLSVGF
jgi:glycosyltransferase involved in cell wall biosynthesis